jgi:SAM-dependent methyltransferase
MTTTSKSTPITPQQATWAAGDYARIGVRLNLVGERLCEAVDLHAGERVLDVAAGNGNAALAAARCDCDVLATDFVPALLERAAARARVDGLPMRTQEANAEQLPFDDASFDAVLSTFGVMFAADQAAAARELVRVCRPGGRIGLACWTPQSFVADLFRTVRRHLPAPAGAASPTVWGDEGGVRKLLGSGVEVRTAHHFHTFRYRSSQAFLDEFRTWYGPTLKAFAALPAAGAEQLARDIIDLCNEQNRATDATLVVPAEYLEIVAVRR